MTEKRTRTPKDAELQAMSIISRTLAGLTPAGRQRVLDFVNARQLEKEA